MDVSGKSYIFQQDQYVRYSRKLCGQF